MPTFLTRIGLRFPDHAAERRFVHHFTQSHIGWTQVAMLLGAFTYLVYFVWDWILYPEIVPTTLAIRGGVTLFVLLPLTALLSTHLRRWAETIYLVYCIVPGCVLCWIYLVIPSGFSHAAAGLIIVILFVSTLLPLRILSLVAFCVSTWISLAVAETFATDLQPGLRFINHFEIGTAYALSLYAVGAREYQARRQFETADALRIEKERSEASLEELRKTQSYLIQSEKLASLGQLIAGVAHEVSTPLGIALTTSTVLEGDIRAVSKTIQGGQIRRSELTHGIARLEQGVQMTTSNLHRATALVDSFKQVAIDQANEEWRSFELRGWLSDHLAKLEPLLSRRGLTLKLISPDGILVDTYPGALAQVVSNLALNAAAHAYPSGVGDFLITVSQPDTATVRLVCADHGVGVAADIRDRVFDPFVTTRRDRGSTGLGLHIVFNTVVSTLDGHISLASEPNAGTQVTIDLPTRRQVRSAA